MTQPSLHTDRIRLVPLGEEHLELEVELDSDPEVMRHLTGAARTRTQVESAHRMRMATADAVAGLGFWIGFTGEEFVGWWLLEPAGWGAGSLVEGEAELGYRLLRRHWRQGLASEGSRELLRYAFQDLGLHRVFAETMAVNAGSRATMASVGLAVRANVPDDEAVAKGLVGAELGGVEYAITRDQWRAAQPTPED